MFHSFNGEKDRINDWYNFIKIHENKRSLQLQLCQISVLLLQYLFLYLQLLKF